MSIPITSWLRAFFALQQCAMDHRGSIEVQIGDDEAIRWPRTIGRDVISIAAAIDPYLRDQRLRFGGQGLARRWRACADDLERYALSAPNALYPENQMFWNTLPALCVFLHAQQSPLPPQPIWDSLLAELSAPRDFRNVGPKGDGPFKRFDNVKLFDDLFNVQLAYLKELRGFDRLKPEPGMTGAERVTPRSTNGDVVALADYWTKQLASVKRIMERDSIEKQWKAALVDVERIARKGDPNAEYTKNNAFWRVLQRTAIHVALADEAPTKADLAIAAIKESITNLPDTVKSTAAAVSSAVGDVAHGVGKVAGEAGRGLFSGFGAPLLIGAGLVGLFLISRASRGDRAEA